MKIKYILVGILAIGLLSGFSPVVAQGEPGFGPPPEGPEMGPGRMRPDKQGGPERLFRDIDLTTEQKTKLLEDRQAMERDLLPSEQKNETIMMKMHEEMIKDKPDQGAIEGYLKEISKNRLNMELKRTDFLLKFWGLLTPEQKEKFRTTEKNIWRKMKQVTGKTGK